MPKKKKIEKTDDSLIRELEQQFDSAETEQHKFRDDPYCTWTEKEQILLNRPTDKITESTKSKVYDPRLATEVFNGESRVMAQFPTGKVQALNDKSDAGKNVLMNLVLTKYVQKNANYQFPFLTKLRMVDRYSRVYGSYPVLIDYRADDDYVGPDLFLIPPRNLYPQAGAISLNVCQYAFVEVWKSLKWLVKRPKDTWQNIDKLYELAKNKGGEEMSEQRSFNETQYMSDDNDEIGDNAKVRLITRYEKDRWVTFSPEYKLVLRDIPNPHDNDEIPIKMKHYIPLADRFWGLGMFERGKTLQYAHNSLLNLYLDGIKKGLFPPTIVNPNFVVTSTLENMFKPTGIVFETQAGAIREMNVSPSGQNTFMSTAQYLIGAMQNMSSSPGSVSIGKESDPTQGKTPEAIKTMNFQQSVSDSQDQFQMEQFIDEVYNTIADMLAKRQDKPINLELFSDDIEEIQKYYPDVTEVYESGNFGTAKVTKDMLGGTKYRYNVDAGSTLKKDNEQENKNLMGLIGMYMQSPALGQTLQMEGKQFMVGEALKRVMITSGTKDWDKLLVDVAQGQQGMGQGGMGQPGQPEMAMPEIPTYQDPEVEAMAQQVRQLAGGQNGSIGS
jgi:hypothetical protein